MADVHKIRKGQKVRVVDPLGVTYEGDFSVVVPAQPTRSEAKLQREWFVVRNNALIFYFPVKGTEVKLVRR